MSSGLPPATVCSTFSGIDWDHPAYQTNRGTDAVREKAKTEYLPQANADGHFSHPDHFIALCDVDLHGDRPATARSDLIRYCFDSVRIQIADAHSRAFFRRPQSNGSADSSCRAGDQSP